MPSGKTEASRPRLPGMTYQGSSASPFPLTSSLTSMSPASIHLRSGLPPTQWALP